jgi:Family of unknown function (DUF5681)
MSASADKDRIEHPGKNQPTGNYEVGYCKPPLAHRFKHGNQANPKGRRKRSRNRKLVIEEILLEPIAVREGNEVKKMSKLEAMLKKTMSKALTGDHKAALMIMGIAQQQNLLSPEQEDAIGDLPENDRAILQDALSRMGHDNASDSLGPSLSASDVRAGAQ